MVPIVLLPTWFSASDRPTVVSDLPSPSGVGVMPVTSMYRPLGLSFKRCENGRRVDFGDVLAVRVQLGVVHAQALGHGLDRLQLESTARSRGPSAAVSFGSQG